MNKPEMEPLYKLLRRRLCFQIWCVALDWSSYNIILILKYLFGRDFLALPNKGVIMFWVVDHVEGVSKLNRIWPIMKKSTNFEQSMCFDH